MLSAIDFDNQLVLMTIEVKDIATMLVLASKLRTGYKS
jgi:hypothetical protein